jgi:hypothetical protein
MIRIEHDDGWILISHPDHARLAGQIAEHWGNDDFAAPEPRADILEAVYRHDDAWAARDAAPKLTREGKPSAFSRELVGKYSAFEEMDLADYLAVRGRAAATVAADNPYAALIVSMHTVDLLSEQSDPSGLNEADRARLTQFIADQRRWQDELIVPEAHAAPGTRHRAFEFLQACDSLSLTACTRYPKPIPLRHRHPDRRGTLQPLVCTPLGGDTYRIAPYPFDQDQLEFKLPYRWVSGHAFAALDSFREQYDDPSGASALRVRIVRDGP